jgi:hypothetical protein
MNLFSYKETQEMNWVSAFLLAFMGIGFFLLFDVYIPYELIKNILNNGWGNWNWLWALLSLFLLVIGFFAGCIAWFSISDQILEHRHPFQLTVSKTSLIFQKVDSKKKGYKTLEIPIKHIKKCVIEKQTKLIYRSKYTHRTPHFYIVYKENGETKYIDFHLVDVYFQNQFLHAITALGIPIKLGKYEVKNCPPEYKIEALSHSKPIEFTGSIKDVYPWNQLHEKHEPNYYFQCVSPLKRNNKRSS